MTHMYTSVKLALRTVCKRPLGSDLKLSRGFTLEAKRKWRDAFASVRDVVRRCWARGALLRPGPPYTLRAAGLIRGKTLANENFPDK
mmetsp:Transcript_6149/g.16381  ORF Transcript_6149/g.16381 Transcript_6149/m.16381 type:complete len:87 (-) Transcript_6149:1341-1601(-)